MSSFTSSRDKMAHDLDLAFARPPFIQSTMPKQDDKAIAESLSPHISGLTGLSRSIFKEIAAVNDTTTAINAEISNPAISNDPVNVSTSHLNRTGTEQTTSTISNNAEILEFETGSDDSDLIADAFTDLAQVEQNIAVQAAFSPVITNDDPSTPASEQISSAPVETTNLPFSNTSPVLLSPFSETSPTEPQLHHLAECNTSTVDPVLLDALLPVPDVSVASPHVHNNFIIKTASTVKCDECQLECRQGSEVYQCRKCVTQICKECVDERLEKEAQADRGTIATEKYKWGWCSPGCHDGFKAVYLERKEKVGGRGDYNYEGKDGEKITIWLDSKTTGAGSHKTKRSDDDELTGHDDEEIPMKKRKLNSDPMLGTFAMPIDVDAMNDDIKSPKSNTTPQHQVASNESTRTPGDFGSPCYQRPAQVTESIPNFIGPLPEGIAALRQQGVQSIVETNTSPLSTPTQSAGSSNHEFPGEYLVDLHFSPPPPLPNDQLENIICQVQTPVQVYEDQKHPSQVQYISSDDEVIEVDDIDRFASIVEITRQQDPPSEPYPYERFPYLGNIPCPFGNGNAWDDEQESPSGEFLAGLQNPILTPGEQENFETQALCNIEWNALLAVVGRAREFEDWIAPLYGNYGEAINGEDLFITYISEDEEKVWERLRWAGWIIADDEDAHAAIVPPEAIEKLTDNSENNEDDDEDDGSIHGKGKERATFLRQDESIDPRFHQTTTAPLLDNHTHSRFRNLKGPLNTPPQTPSNSSSSSSPRPARSPWDTELYNKFYNVGVGDPIVFDTDVEDEKWSTGDELFYREWLANTSHINGERASFDERQDEDYDDEEEMTEDGNESDNESETNDLVDNQKKFMLKHSQGKDSGNSDNIFSISSSSSSSSSSEFDNESDDDDADFADDDVSPPSKAMMPPSLRRRRRRAALKCNSTTATYAISPTPKQKRKASRPRISRATQRAQAQISSSPIPNSSSPVHTVEGTEEAKSKKRAELPTPSLRLMGRLRNGKEFSGASARDLSSVFGSGSGRPKQAGRSLSF